MSALGTAKNRAAARAPSKKGTAGILAGGLGVAAMATRRRGGSQDDTPPPPPPGEASGEDNNPSAA